MKKRWPQINFADAHWGIFEPECGYLDARASCQAVVDAFIAAGGKYRQAAVSSEGLKDAPLRSFEILRWVARESRQICIRLRAVDGKTVSGDSWEK